MTWQNDLVSAVGRFLARAIGGPAAHARAIWQATQSVAAGLTDLISEDVAADIRDYREELKKRAKAQTDKERAEADLAIAQAQEAANKAIRSKRPRAIQKLDEERKRLENVREAAEIKRISAEIENSRLDAHVRARIELVAAAERLKACGGKLVLDPENLKQIIKQASRLYEAPNDPEEL